MYLSASVYPFMDHVLVRLVATQQPELHEHLMTPSVVTRDVYLPDSGYKHVDLLNALGVAVADLVRSITEGDEEILPDDHVDRQQHVVQDPDGSLRVEAGEAVELPPWTAPVE